MQISTTQNHFFPQIYNKAASVVVNNSNLRQKMDTQYLLCTLSLSRPTRKRQGNKVHS